MNNLYHQRGFKVPFHLPARDKSLDPTATEVYVALSVS